LIFIIFLLITPHSVRAADISYQGTHILTYSAMKKLSDAFQRKTGIEIPIRGGGCSDGIASVIDGRASMGGLCCPLPKKYEKEDGLIQHAVGRDIKVVVVNQENPLNNITLRDLQAIHRGEITNWKDLGWIDRPIAVIYRKHCLWMDEPVRRLLDLKSDLSNLSPRAIIVRTDMELLEHVSRFSSAIAITSKVFAVKKDIRILRVNGVRPTPVNVRLSRYPLTGTLYIVTRGRPRGVTKRFLDFVLSPEGQAIITGSNLSGVR